MQVHWMHVEVELTLNGDPIKVVGETKFVGVNAKLSFLPHIKYFKT